ncbi:hypothetical protein EDD16DRAFT_1600553 [Pisolithus croceorrhizus]|nr:hypothetical protein EDD16DRAFT_1600553 [Pisolithus croceorrhizus]
MYEKTTIPFHQRQSRHKKRAIAFFSDVFGLSYLRNYARIHLLLPRTTHILPSLSSYMHISPCELTFTTLEDVKLPTHPSKLPFIGRNLCRGNRQSSAVPEPRLKAVVPLLLRRCQASRVEGEVQKMKHELESVSQTLSASLLVHISTTFDIAARVPPAEQWGYVYDDYADYDRQLNTHPEIQQIQELKVKLDVTEDDDERRTLEEDMTGKILWLCWCGICAEVDQLLPMVLDCIQREGFNWGLHDISNIINSISVDPDHDRAHLQRIMLDAGAGIAKHRLFLSARTIKNTQGTNYSPSTSDRPPDESNL